MLDADIVFSRLVLLYFDPLCVFLTVSLILFPICRFSSCNHARVHRQYIVIIAVRFDALPFVLHICVIPCIIFARFAMHSIKCLLFFPLVLVVGFKFHFFFVFIVGRWDFLFVLLLLSFRIAVVTCPSNSILFDTMSGGIFLVVEYGFLVDKFHSQL